MAVVVVVAKLPKNISKALTKDILKLFFKTSKELPACRRLLFPLLHAEKGPRATKEIGDVCTQATKERPLNNSIQEELFCLEFLNKTLTICKILSSDYQSCMKECDYSQSIHPVRVQ